jgi:YfiH family protein
MGSGFSDKQWRRIVWDGIPFHQSSMMTVLSGMEHGFTTRLGGCSQPPFGSLNMSFTVGDETEKVVENRRRTAGALGFTVEDITTAEQVHGSKVSVVTLPGVCMPGADALVTNHPNILLLLNFADCVPIFVFDPFNRVIALIHSGWRGTDTNITRKTIDVMKKEFGTDPTKCVAAIGPCIGFERYEVGLNVAELFRNSDGGNGAPSTHVVVPFNEFKGTYLLNLRQVVFHQLAAAGFRINAIAVSDECTVSNKTDFFSHRRDGEIGIKTGRMAALIGMKS